MQKLAVVMDFKLDSASPPMLLTGGTLRMAVWTALASELMYYGEHFATCESRADQVAMHDGITLHDDAGSDASSTLRAWGDAIRTRSDADNLRLTTKAADDGTAQVMKAIQGFDGTLSKLRRAGHQREPRPRQRRSAWPHQPLRQTRAPRPSPRQPRARWPRQPRAAGVREDGGLLHEDAQPR